MSTQPSANSQNRYRYRIKRIEIRPVRKVNGKIWAELLVDGGIVHAFSSINKGQSLAWDDPLHWLVHHHWYMGMYGNCICSDLRSDSLISFQIHELEASLFKHKHTLRCNIEFSTSDISNELPVCSIERSSDALSVSFTFFNPPSVLNPDTIHAAFETILNFGTSVFKLCPAVAHTVFSSCQTACERLRDGTEYSKDIEELAIGFADILRPIPLVDGGNDSKDLIDTTGGILELIQKASVFVINYISMTQPDRRESTFVSSCRCRVQKFLEQLGQLKHDFDQQLREEAAYLARVGEAVDRLKPVAHSTHHGNRECLPGTRTILMGDIHEWIEREAGFDRLLWIHGPSGIGKSAIATSVCRSLEARNLLCASFFCRWDNPELCEPESVIGSIVYGLAKHHTGYGKQAASVIHYDPESPDLWFDLFYEGLVTIPLVAATNQATEVESTCIVIDALDQCEDSQTRRGLLSYLFHLSQHASWLKVIVTSCPDQDIQDFFDSVSEGSMRRMDICKYDASNDISVFIRNRMFSGPSNPFRLDDSHVSLLADSASGLLIWADIVCKIISDKLNPQQHLVDILRNSAVAEQPSPQLDLLYVTVLKEYAPDMNKEHASKRRFGALDSSDLHPPLPIDSLERLLAEYLHAHELAAAQNILRVLIADHSDDRRSVARAYHRSFINYITTQSRSEDFYVDATKQNAIFSSRCLSTMLNGLKFDICGLETSYVRNSDVPDLESRVISAIGPPLSYSCLCWIDHVIRTDPTYVDTALLKGFLFSRTIFYWIEALSLLNKLDVAVSQLPRLVAWIQESPDLAELVECAHDAYRFITTFYDVITESAPHLYLSAIAFAPTNSGMSRRGREWFPNTPKLVKGALRSWEPCLHILAHSGLVLCVASSPDNRTIVTGCHDHTVRLWDVAIGPKVIARLIGHSDRVWSVAFSPDGRYVASGSHDQTVRVWDAKAGDKILEPVMGHSGPVLSVAFSRDGRHIVSGSHDKTVRMWDVETGAAACAPLVGHSRPVLSVACSPNGGYIASGSFDKTVRIWDPERGELAVRTGHTGWVRAVAFSHGSQRIVSGSCDKTIRMWDVEPSGRVYAPIVGHSGMVNSVAFSPDDRCIISGSSDKTVRVWDPETGAQLCAPLAGHSDQVLSAVFSCDGGRILSCSSDQTVRMWDVPMVIGKENHEFSIEHSESSPSDLPEGHRTVLDSDQTMPIWKEMPAAEASVSLVGHSGIVWSVAFSPDGKRIASGSDDETLRIWDAETGVEVSSPVVSHSSSVSSIAFSPDSRRIVSGSWDKTVRIWDAGTGTQLFAPLTGHSDFVWSVAFSPDGRRIVSGSSDRTVRMWNAQTGSQLPEPLVGHSGLVLSVAFSPDSRRIVSGSIDETVRSWDAETGTDVSAPLVGHSNSVNSVAFSPDGRRIVSGSDDRTVRIWDTDSGAQVFVPLIGHSDQVQSVAFSPDGRFIVSGSWDKTVRMWDAETGTQVSAPLVGHSDGVTSVAFSPDGRRIVSGSWDKTVRIWDVVHHLLTAGNRLNLSSLFPLMESAGWVSLPGKPYFLWIPSELRPPTVDAGSTHNPSQTIPPSSRVVIDLSQFVHGRRWVSVAAD